MFDFLAAGEFEERSGAYWVPLTGAGLGANPATAEATTEKQQESAQQREPAQQQGQPPDGAVLAQEWRGQQGAEPAAARAQEGRPQPQSQPRSPSAQSLAESEALAARNARSQQEVHEILAAAEASRPASSSAAANAEGGGQAESAQWQPAQQAAPGAAAAQQPLGAETPGGQASAATEQQPPGLDRSRRRGAFMLPARQEEASASQTRAAMPGREPLPGSDAASRPASVPVAAGASPSGVQQPLTGPQQAAQLPSIPAQSAETQPEAQVLGPTSQSLQAAHSQPATAGPTFQQHCSSGGAPRPTPEPGQTRPGSTQLQHPTQQHSQQQHLQQHSQQPQQQQQQQQQQAAQKEVPAAAAAAGGAARQSPSSLAAASAALQLRQDHHQPQHLRLPPLPGSHTIPSGSHNATSFPAPVALQVRRPACAHLHETWSDSCLLSSVGAQALQQMRCKVTCGRGSRRGVGGGSRPGLQVAICHRSTLPS